MTASPAWTQATPGDLPVVLSLMRAFYAEERLDYDDARSSKALRELLAGPELGAVFLLRREAEAQGYLMLTFGFSPEFGGRFALLDELYLAPDVRGQGQGKAALAHAEAWASAQGARTTRLEVTRHNAKALSIYLKYGYRDDGRRILTKWAG